MKSCSVLWYRLFAKDKSKKQKDRMTAAMVSVVENIQAQLKKALP
jgi:hypothetical protein